MEAYPDSWQRKMFVKFREMFVGLAVKRTIQFRFELNVQVK